MEDKKCECSCGSKNKPSFEMGEIEAVAIMEQNWKAFTDTPLHKVDLSNSETRNEKPMTFGFTIDLKTVL